MATPIIDAIRDYSQRARDKGLQRRMTLASATVRALERKLAAAGMQMSRIERPSSRAEPVPALFGVELVEEKETAPQERKPLRTPTLSDIVEGFLR